MENLLTINSTTAVCDEYLEINVLFVERLSPLLQKFKYRLSQFEQTVNSDSKRLQTYTNERIRKACEAVETLEKEWHGRWQVWSLADKTHQQNIKAYVTQALEQSFADLSEKYHEMENVLLTSDDYIEKTLDDTIDALMSKIEEVDGRISDALECAAEVRDKAYEKFNAVAGKASEQMDHLKRAMAIGAKQLLSYEELPIPWRNNMHIRTGYRFLSTPAQCWQSLLYWHNETGNIYTHLIGFLVFLGIGIYEMFYSGLLSDVPTIDRIIFAVFFCAACKCLMCSTVWHTLSGINDYPTFKRVACLDYVGISVLICASVVLTEYYGFYCNDMWRATYMSGTGTLAIIGIWMPFMDWFEKHEMRWLRISFFVTLAASAAIPVAHMFLAYGVKETLMWTLPVSKSIGCYLLGVVVYGNQWPERFWPGRFDHIGHSHQLWHLFVCGGIWYHYIAAVSFVSQRESFGMCHMQ